MAIPVAGSYASFDVTARTEGRSVNSVLFDAMFAKSRVLELIGLGSRIPQTRHEWISLAPPAITVTGVASGTTIDGSATLLALEVSAADALLCPPGTRLKNASRATPIGTYKVDEVMEVVTVTGAVLTLKRAINGDGTNGSDAHAATDPDAIGTRLTDLPERVRRRDRR